MTPGFQDFWAGQRELAGRPRAVETRQIPFPGAPATYYELSFPGTDGAPLRARYIQTPAKSPAPAVLIYHDDGRAVRGWHHMTRFSALGYSVIALENRRPFWDISAGWENAPGGLAAAQLYTDAMTAAYVARALPEIDPERLVTWGEGLGGGLAIAVAALVPGVVRCAALNPLPAGPELAWEQGYSQGLLGGILAHFRGHDPEHAQAEAFFQAMGYLDCAGFAPALRCPLLLGTGLMDKAAPPACQQLVADRAAGPVTHLKYPKYEHERINFFENELLKFLHF